MAESNPAGDNYSIDTKGNPKAAEFFLQGLRNQHAVETQAIATYEPQLARYVHYADLHAVMQKDLENTRRQAARLEQLLSARGSSISGTKETVTSVVGTVAGLVHITAEDQVVKDVFAGAGFKQYEIVSYRSLIRTAQLIGDNEAIPVLEASLAEEESIREWQDKNTAEVVATHLRRYVNEA